MRKMIAVDPGDRWCGVAFFEEDPDAKYGWECVDAQEFGPDEFEMALAETIIDSEIDVLVYERWRLYADKSREQTGSEFRASQCIGAMKFLVRAHNAHVERHQEVNQPGSGKMLSCELEGGTCADPEKVIAPVTIVGQMADIMKPAKGILNARKIKSVAKKISREEYQGRDHVISAELHGWYWILKVDRNGK